MLLCECVRLTGDIRKLAPVPLASKNTKCVECKGLRFNVCHSEGKMEKFILEPASERKTQKKTVKFYLVKAISYNLLIQSYSVVLQLRVLVVMQVTSCLQTQANSGNLLQNHEGG